jgi:DNA-binding transcriptional LysR family regulator
MELMQLEIFVAIVEEGSMTNAGRRVFRTQPAISLSLRNLENELGVPLICRPRKYPLVLTPAGVLLHHYAKCLLALRDNARAAVKTCGQALKADARARNAKLPPLLTTSYGQHTRSRDD